MKTLKFTFIFLLLTGLSYSQAPHMLEIYKKADIYDFPESSKLDSIPELRSTDGELIVHLFAHEDSVNFDGDKIKLRNYSYEFEGRHYKIDGPFGPTLIVKPSDRLSMIVHNDLPVGPDINYLGSISIDTIILKIVQPGFISNEMATLLIVETDGGITWGNLDGAIVAEIESGLEWEVYGKEPCECPPGEEGTCEYKEIIYTIKKMFNPGTKEYALRIYETMDHSGEDHNTPHGFNTTNMHAHGFHVSPFQDDIFRAVPPGNSSYYTYDLENHTPGTMWYHPHVHGSTALQVASGMSGVIVIEDDRDTLSNFPDLVKASDPKRDKVLLFNQIFYDNEIHDLPDFNTLRRSKAHKGTTINGKAVPNMHIQPGEVQRWRLVHSGYHALLGIYFPPEIEVYQIAIDGIMFEKARKLTSLHMAPGNRSDILIRVPKNKKSDSTTINIYSMDYNVVCEYFPEDSVCVNMDTSNAETIMKLVVGGKSMDMKFPEGLALPGPGPELKDIKNGDISDSTFIRKTDFNITQSIDGFNYLVNKKAFEADTIHEILTLGEAEKWELTSSYTDHPYHIHINPFQVTELRKYEVGKDGRAVRKDHYKPRMISPPIWKDVALVNPEYSNLIRTRYQKYWGDFVMHCHILHHEDKGMMQRIRIQRPKPKIWKEPNERK